MARLRAASIALALIATMNGGIAYAQGVPDWGPVPTFEVIRQHTETGDRTWLRPYELDVLAPKTAAGMAGLDDTVLLNCLYTAGATFASVDGRANYACDDGRWLMGDPVGGTKLMIVIVPPPTPQQLARPDTLLAQLAIITRVTVAVEE